MNTSYIFWKSITEFLGCDLGLLKYNKFTPLEIQIFFFFFFEIQIFNEPDILHTDCTTKSDISLAKSTFSTHKEFLTY